MAIGLTIRFTQDKTAHQKSQMKIVISSGNSIGQPTGYGAQTTILARTFRAQGHEVISLAWTAMMGKHNSFKMIPMKQYLNAVPSLRTSMLESDKELFAEKTWVMANPYNQWPVVVEKKALNHILRITQADVFIAFQDIFLFQPGPFIRPAFVWMPCHFMPLEHKTLRSLDSFDGIIAMSEYGRMFLGDYFGKERCGSRAKLIDYVPHGRDINLFKPLDPDTADVRRTELRTKLGWPQDAFVVLVVAANTEGSNRKAFDAQLAAFAKFAQRRDARQARGEHESPPGGWKSFLHVHSNAAGEMDLPRILEFHGECPNRHEFIDFVDENGKTRVLDSAKGARGPRFSVTPPDKYGKLSEAEMVEMYHAADVTMVGSCSEGFGVPIIEAQLCGCPVVTNRSTAMPELTRFGYSVRPAQWIMRNDFVSGWQQPSRDGLARALDSVAAWTPKRRAELLNRHLPTLQSRYSDKAVREGWGRVADKIVGHMQPDGSMLGRPAKRKMALSLGKTQQQIFLEIAKGNNENGEIRQRCEFLSRKFDALVIQSKTMCGFLGLV